MPYQLIPEPNEQIVLDVRLQPSPKFEPFHFAVSNQAVYLPAKRFVVSGDPTYFQKVPLNQVTNVSVQQPKPYGAWIFALLMVLVGGFFEIMMMLPILMQAPGHHPVSGIPLALLVGGVLLPFAAKGQKRLVIGYENKNFKWTPPLVVDHASKEQIAQTIENILTACRKVGISVD